MTSIFWDSQAVIMIDYLEQGRMNASPLRLLHQEIARNRQGKLTRGVLSLAGNALAHASQVALTVETEYGFFLLDNCSFYVKPIRFLYFLSQQSVV